MALLIMQILSLAVIDYLSKNDNIFSDNKKQLRNLTKDKGYVKNEGFKNKGQPKTYSKLQRAQKIALSITSAKESCQRSLMQVRVQKIALSTASAKESCRSSLMQVQKYKICKRAQKIALSAASANESCQRSMIQSQHNNLSN